MKKTAKKTHWLRTTIIVLVICGIAGLALTSVLFFKNPDPTYAYATIQFTFDGAADGVAPNGSIFDMSGIFSDEVLSGALAEANLAEVYTPEQIRTNLVVRGVYPEDMVAQVMNYESLLNFTANRETTVGDFHPTTFNLVLYDDFADNVSQAQLEALLQGLLTSYKSYFSRVYSNGLVPENLLFDVDNYDYPQQLEIIQGHFETMAQYAAEMYEMEPTFRLEGYGFNDINVRLRNLIRSDISRLNADLTMNALTRNTARLLTQYQFEIRDLSNTLDKQTKRLEKVDKLIESYDKNEIIYLSTTDSLTKIDGNSSETYDSLVEDRKEIADGITDINSQIATYQLRLSDLLKEENTATTTHVATASETETETAFGDSESAEEVVAMTEEEIAQAAEEAERQSKAQTAALESNISALIARGDAVIDDFSAMLEAYNAQEINDMTVSIIRTEYEAPKVVSGAFIKKAIKTAGPICAIGFMLCMALIIASRKKEEKRR